MTDMSVYPRPAHSPVSAKKTENVMVNRNRLAAAATGQVVIGVDTHKDFHVAAALDATAGVLATVTVPACERGFETLLAWARAFGVVLAFGVEGTGSYGAPLTRFLQGRDLTVVEVVARVKTDRRRRGKSDALDAENAARAVLAGFEDTTPKSRDGYVEMIRTLKVSYDTAVKARTQSMNAIKAELVVADEALRDATKDLKERKLIKHLASLRPTLTDPDSARRLAIKTMARRWLALEDEAKETAALIADLVTQAAPELLALYGVGAMVAADILIAIGDNPERIESEAAFANMAGTAPKPAGSGKTSGRHRLSRGGNRRLNAALHHIALTRKAREQRTRDYIAKRTLEGKTNREITRCLKRYIAREIYKTIKTNQTQEKLPTAA